MAKSPESVSSQTSAIEPYHDGLRRDVQVHFLVHPYLPDGAPTTLIDSLARVCYDRPEQESFQIFSHNMRQNPIYADASDEVIRKFDQSLDRILGLHLPLKRNFQDMVRNSLDVIQDPHFEQPVFSAIEHARLVQSIGTSGNGQ